VLEQTVAVLENGKYGLAFSSGLGALTTLCHLLKTGDHILSVTDVYGGTYRYFNKVISPSFGIQIDQVDMTNLDKLNSAITENTKVKIPFLYSLIRRWFGWKLRQIRL
jgi:cystathionine beta-lyase/cystathionine gamma-synthase